MKARIPACVLLLLSVSGCYSKVTGYEGKLTFAYQSGVEVENFVKPIAPGAKLEVVAFANGTDDELTITGAKSNKPDVLSIVSARGRRLVVKAGTIGVAEIEISAKGPNGEALVDKMFFHVGKPATHGLEHACTEEKKAVYVAGDDVDVFHDMKTADKRPVIGASYAPLEVSPSGAMDLVAQPQGWAFYRFKAKRANANVTLKSTVDGGALSFVIVDRKDLKEANLACTGECRMFEGKSQYAFVRVRHGDLPVCNQRALTKAKSLTPEVCSVTAKLEDDDEEESLADSNRWQIAVIKGLKFGNCKYEVTLPELDGGRGLTLKGTAKIGRQQFPGDDSAEGAAAARWSWPWWWPRDYASLSAIVLVSIAVKALFAALVMIRRKRA